MLLDTNSVSIMPLDDDGVSVNCKLDVSSLEVGIFADAVVSIPSGGVVI